MKNPKAKGSRNERRSIAFLEQRGFRCTKAGGSLGVWDIIGISADRILLVQVKSNRNASPADRQIMQKFPAPPNAAKQIHIWRDRQKIPTIMPLNWEAANIP